MEDSLINSLTPFNYGPYRRRQFLIPGSITNIPSEQREGHYQTTHNKKLRYALAFDGDRDDDKYCIQSETN